jgi:hypothetical protein
MKRILFGLSLICNVLVCIFMLTKLSLNGYIADFYFIIFTLALNFSCYLIFRNDKPKGRSIFHLLIFILQIIGICIFLSVDTLQVDMVYTPKNNKENLYSTLTGWYTRAYYKPRKREQCNGGILWQTRVPYYFPLIEIEIKRDDCHRVDTGRIYNWLFKHVPE